MKWFRKDNAPVAPAAATATAISPDQISPSASAADASANTASAAEKPAEAAQEAPKQKAMARRFLRNTFNVLFNEKLSKVFGDVTYFGAYLPVKAVTVSPTTAPISAIWNYSAKKPAPSRWMTRLALALPWALITPTALQPLAYRAAFLAVTHKTYSCTINPEDPVSTKPYPYSPTQEALTFPLGYAVGFQNTWLNERFKIMTPPPASGNINKFLLHAMCDDGQGGQEAQTFEITDTWFRGDKKFRSGDIATELAANRGRKVEIGAAGIRYGLESWFKNVLSYKVTGP